jgi:hypothetical protein
MTPWGGSEKMKPRGQREGKRRTKTKGKRRSAELNKKSCKGGGQKNVACV